MKTCKQIFYSSSGSRHIGEKDMAEKQGVRVLLLPTVFKNFFAAEKF